MPKLGMAPIRRRQLVEAVIDVIHEAGFNKATVARIAKRAGMSSGLIHHYFADKDELLFATMRHLLSDLRADTVRRLAAALSPEERIYAIIDANFGETQFDERIFGAWLALYGNARQSKRLQRILTIYHGRLRSSLLHDLTKLVRRPDALRLTEGIGAMIDGLWLRYALSGGPADASMPRTMTREYVEAVLSRLSSGRIAV